MKFNLILINFVTGPVSYKQKLDALSANIKMHYDVVELNGSLTETNDKIEDGEMTDNRSSNRTSKRSDQNVHPCSASNRISAIHVCMLIEEKKKRKRE